MTPKRREVINLSWFFIRKVLTKYFFLQVTIPEFQVFCHLEHIRTCSSGDNYIIIKGELLGKNEVILDVWPWNHSFHF